MTETAMSVVSEWGAPALFVILAINCLGVPLPTSLIMLALGALSVEGDISAVSFAAAGMAGAIFGDQLGYGLGRMGAGVVEHSVKSRPWLSAALKRAAEYESSWGDLGIFLSRWLLSPLGPYINIVAGTTGYSWPRFTLWVVAGEAVWVWIYIGLGAMFSRSVQMLADLMGSLTWMLAAATMAAFLGWRLFVMASGTSGHRSNRSNSGPVPD